MNPGHQPARRTTDMRRRVVRLGLTAGVCAGLMGCSAPAKPYLDMGRRLADAGFIAHPADTTARYAMMNTLPPGQMTYRPSQVGPVYLYADPVGCGCVYMGSLMAYRTLTASAAARQRRPQPVAAEADIPAMAAENRRDTAAWDWSAWSPYADPGPTQPRHVTGAYW